MSQKLAALSSSLKFELMVIPLTAFANSPLSRFLRFSLNICHIDVLNRKLPPCLRFQGLKNGVLSTPFTPEIKTARLRIGSGPRSILAAADSMMEEGSNPRDCC